MKRLGGRAALLALMVCVFGAASPAWAHDGLHEQIAALTARIRKSPRNAELYLERGELYRLHGERAAALADYAAAARLNPDLAAVDFARGMLFYEAGRLKAAKAALTRFLLRQPGHADALVTRARVLVKLGRRLDAAADFTRAIEGLDKPKPEYYLERAHALAAEGGARVEEAVAGLDEGVAKLGPVATLHLLAVELDLERGRYDAALARLEIVAAQSARKEAWLTRRGEILERAGRIHEALDAYAAALAAIEELPAQRRKDRATAELESRLRVILRLNEGRKAVR
jgi:tetratricopeptide (TPR) repeat protein